MKRKKHIAPQFELPVIGAEFNLSGEAAVEPEVTDANAAPEQPSLFPESQPQTKTPKRKD